MQSLTVVPVGIDPLIRMQDVSVILAMTCPGGRSFILTPFGDSELAADPNHDDPGSGIEKLDAELDDAPCGQMAVLHYNETSLFLIVVHRETRSVQYFVATLEEDGPSWDELVLPSDPIGNLLALMRS
jgi:hypothetical protein